MVFDQNWQERRQISKDAASKNKIAYNNAKDSYDEAMRAQKAAFAEFAASGYKQDSPAGQKYFAAKEKSKQAKEQMEVSKDAYRNSSTGWQIARTGAKAGKALGSTALSAIGLTPKKSEPVEPQKPNNTDSQEQSSEDKAEKDSNFDANALGSAMYDALGIWASKNTKDPLQRDKHLNRQAEMHDVQSGDHQKSAQHWGQIANRDYRVEAEKNAVSQAASENNQKVQNLGNASAGAAALERGVKSADYNTHMQRADQAQKEYTTDNEKMWDDRQAAEQERAGADVYNGVAQDMQTRNSMSSYLSHGNSGVDNLRPQQPEQQPEQPQQEQPEQPQQQPEQQPQQEQLQSDWMSVLNYATYANAPEGTRGAHWNPNNESGKKNPRLQNAIKLFNQAGVGNGKVISAQDVRNPSMWNDNWQLEQVLDRVNPEIKQKCLAETGRLRSDGSHSNEGDSKKDTLNNYYNTGAQQFTQQQQQQ